jgi:hypothetical protein
MRPDLSTREDHGTATDQRVIVNHAPLQVSVMSDRAAVTHDRVRGRCAVDDRPILNGRLIADDDPTVITS